MARVVAVFDDLLLGSNVLGMLRAAGYEAELSGADAHPDGADALIVDLASTGFDGVALVERLRGEGELEGTRTLGVYSHVDATPSAAPTRPASTSWSRARGWRARAPRSSSASLATGS